MYFRFPQISFRVINTASLEGSSGVRASVRCGGGVLTDAAAISDVDIQVLEVGGRGDAIDLHASAGVS